MKKLTSILITSFLAFICVYSVANAQVVVQGDSLWRIAQNAGMSLSTLIGLNPQVANPNLIYPGQEINTGNDILGNSLPIAGNTYNLSGSGITKSATSITLQSLTIKQTGRLIVDADLPDTFYITAEPGSDNRQEIISCTTVTQNLGGTATLSGCSRGLLPFTPYTASTTYAFSHAGGTQVIFSDAPQLFNEYTAKSNAETINAVWTYNSFPIIATSTALPTTNGQFATKLYVDNVGAGGFTAANVGTGKTLRANGTSPETMDVNTSTASNFSFIIENSKFEVATGTGSRVANTLVDFVAGTNTWTGTNTFNGTTTLATTTVPNQTAASSTSNNIANLKFVSDFSNILFATSTNPSRSVNTYYQNTTGKPMIVYAGINFECITNTSYAANITFSVGVATTSGMFTVGTSGFTGTANCIAPIYPPTSFTFIVPNNYYYTATYTYTTEDHISIKYWNEAY
jgi:LysM repeat protein